MDKNGKFYIGRAYNLKKKALLEEPTLYDPDDLTTHGVVVGMTGSGKTGLGVDILEEAALQGIPGLLIDPKGDIANLLLHFPNLAPQDFEPWMDPDEARREGKTIKQLAADTAETWKTGLAKWEIGPDRIKRVAKAVKYAVYTPGSDAGIPVSILTSLNAPDVPWEENREILRERLSSTATALLGLVGIEADPVRSREHILLANLFEHAWQQGLDLDLPELIRQIQSPPFQKLGAFEVDKFYPQDDRFKLAMLINNLLAAPSFQAWVEGVPLDIDKLLWTQDGTPRQSVFYLAHLSDAERMFFVTLLLTAVEAWMVQQSGSDSLRAMLYFDEVFGFLPPVAVPPSKPPLLRLLKQARAFGLGVLLTTQNPADLDYKGLSNAGTWFIGRLQTERDKERLMDGLEGLEAGDGGFDRKDIDKTISALGKRVFYLHNVHEKRPQIFHTRWAMAYLKGPITRAQLGHLNELVKAEDDSVARPELTTKQETPAPVHPVSTAVSTTKPNIPTGVDEMFLPNNLTLSQALKSAGKEAPQAKNLGLVYKPALLAQAKVRYLDRKKEIDHDDAVTALSHEVDVRGVVRWEEILTSQVDAASLDRTPAPEAQFTDLVDPLSNASTLKALQKDFVDYVYHNAGLSILTNPTLKLFAEPGVSRADFMKQCTQSAQDGLDEETEKLKKGYETKIKRIEERLAREQRELAEDQADLQSRKMEELATHAENVLGLFSGSRSRRRVSSSLSKRRMTSKAKADVEESLDVIEDLKEELAELEDELADELDELNQRWSDAAAEIEETVITPYKKDIHIDLYGVAWFPFWQIQEGDIQFDIPGYSA